jgi:predicted RNase H-like HicB family nuclease
MKFEVLLHRSDEEVSVSVSALPGSWSEGETEEEALANIQDAIREYLAALEARFRSRGRPRGRRGGVAVERFLIAARLALSAKPRTINHAVSTSPHPSLIPDTFTIPTQPSCFGRWASLKGGRISEVGEAEPARTRSLPRPLSAAQASETMGVRRKS